MGFRLLKVTSALICCGISMLSSNAYSRNDVDNMDIRSVMSKTDPKSALFMLNVYTNREQIIENRLKFNMAKGMLPASYDGHTLESMDIKDGILYLIFSTRRPEIPAMWKNSPAKIRAAYHNAVCRVFAEGKITRVSEIHSTLYFENGSIGSLSEHRRNCGNESRRH